MFENKSDKDFNQEKVFSLGGYFSKWIDGTNPQPQKNENGINQRIPKTGNEFQIKASLMKIESWNIIDCSCGYKCKFMWNNENGIIMYDNGCYCSKQEPRLTNWDELADQYNIQTNPGIIKIYDKFWGF